MFDPLQLLAALSPQTGPLAHIGRAIAACCYSTPAFASIAALSTHVLLQLAAQQEELQRISDRLNEAGTGAQVHGHHAHQRSYAPKGGAGSNNTSSSFGTSSSSSSSTSLMTTSSSAPSASGGGRRQLIESAMLSGRPMGHADLAALEALAVQQLASVAAGLHAGVNAAVLDEQLGSQQQPSHQGGGGSFRRQAAALPWDYSLPAGFTAAGPAQTPALMIPLVVHVLSYT